MRIFKTRAFAKWARKNAVNDRKLRDAITEFETGITGNDLGGHLFKKRIAKDSGGKSRGLRCILAYRKNARVFFLYGFAKNARSNIKPVELKALKNYAEVLFDLDNEQLDVAVKGQVLYEIM